GSRAIRRFLRTPETVVNTVIFPLLLLLAIFAAFASAVEAFEGDDYAQRLVPGLVVSGLMFGSVGAAVAFGEDLRSGFMARLRSMPVRPSSPVVGVLVAEIARAVAALLVLGGIGMALGFRFEAGIARALLILPVAVLAGVAITMIGLALATVTSSAEALSGPLGALFLVFMFFSGAMVPVEAYPGWAQALVRVNPATTFVTMLDRLARGGDLSWPGLWTVVWSVVLIVGGTFAVARRLRLREV
ncbi:MAG: ABC transporter permease, partial [Actinomycetota bacterium]